MNPNQGDSNMKSNKERTPEASVIKTARVVSSSSPAGREFNNKILASGYLLKRGQGPMKKWNRRYMVLRGSYGIYQLAWGESAGSRAKGTVGIATGVSTVTKTKQFASGGHKYSFVLSANPQDPKAPVLVACASYSGFSMALNAAVQRRAAASSLMVPL